MEKQKSMLVGAGKEEDQIPTNPRKYIHYQQRCHMVRKVEEGLIHFIVGGGGSWVTDT